MKNKIFTAIIGVLCFFLIVNVFNIYDETQYILTDYSVSVDRLIFSIDYGDYTDLMEDLGDFTPEEIAEDITLTECYHVSEYFKNASLYKAYKDIDTQKAQNYYDQLDFHRENAGLFSYATDDIDAVLEI